MSSVAFIGLGVMGAPMARHLAAAGHQVTVYNRTPEKSLAWVALYGNRAAPTPREAAEGAEFVMMCVGNDDDVREVVYGPDGVLAGAEAGAVLVDHTTASAEVARELAEARSRVRRRLRRRAGVGRPGRCRERAAHGHVRRRRRGVLRVGQAVMAAYAKACSLMGRAGAGQLTKMVNQICIAGVVQGLAEGDQLRAEGRARPRPGRRRHPQGRGAELADGEPRPHDGARRVRLRLRRRVDAQGPRRSCLDEAKRNGARLPLTALVDQFYAQVDRPRRQALGHVEPDPPARQRLTAATLPVASCSLDVSRIGREIALWSATRVEVRRGHLHNRHRRHPRRHNEQHLRCCDRRCLSEPGTAEQRRSKWLS